MTTSRILCPLDCGWHHDQDDFDPTVPQPFASYPAPDGVDPLIWGYSLGRTLVVENALKAHLETHTLLEWVTALTTAQRRIAELERQVASRPPALRVCMGLNVIGPDQDVCGKPSCRCHQVAAEMEQALRHVDLGDGFRWHPLSQCPDEAACPIHGLNEEPDGTTGHEDLPELTREDAIEAMQDMSTDLYRAEDRLAFVREMCDAADREQRQVTTEQVRAWTQHNGCGGSIVLPEDEQQRLKAAMALHSLTGRIIDRAQAEHWKAAGRCGTCGFDGDRTGCPDCHSVAAPATQVSETTEEQ